MRVAPGGTVVELGTAVAVCEGRRGSPGRAVGGALPSVGCAGTDDAVAVVDWVGSGAALRLGSGVVGAPGAGETGRAPGVRVGVWPDLAVAVTRADVAGVAVAEDDPVAAGVPDAWASPPTTSSGRDSSTGREGPASRPKKSSTLAATPGRGEADGVGPDAV